MQELPHIFKLAPVNPLPKSCVICFRERIAAIISFFFAASASLLTCAIKRICVPNILFTLSEIMTLYLLFDTIRYTSAITSSR